METFDIMLFIGICCSYGLGFIGLLYTLLTLVYRNDDPHTIGMTDRLFIFTTGLLSIGSFLNVFFVGFDTSTFWVFFSLFVLGISIMSFVLAITTYKENKKYYSDKD